LGRVNRGRYVKIYDYAVLRIGGKGRGPSQLSLRDIHAAIVRDEHLGYVLGVVSWVYISGVGDAADDLTIAPNEKTCKCVWGAAAWVVLKAPGIYIAIAD
jgi:hypothetical protein